MLRKMILPLVLAIIFSCTQAFAADNAAMYDNDEKSFVTDFNKAAKKLGNFTLKTKMELINSDETSDDYGFEAADDKLKVKGIILKNKNGTLKSAIFFVTGESIATQGYYTGLAALGLTEQEITSKPVFIKETTKTNLWCEKTKRYIKVVTAGDKKADFYIVGFTIAKE